LGGERAFNVAVGTEGRPPEAEVPFVRRARFLEEKQTIDIGRKELSFGDACR
jgi:hypothetical protein